MVLCSSREGVPFQSIKELANFKFGSKDCIPLDNNFKVNTFKVDIL